MECRLNEAKFFLKNNGLISVAIDDEEVSNLRPLLNSIFYRELGVAVVRSNPQSRKASNKFSPVHEYALFYGNSISSIPSTIGSSDGKINRYPLIDSLGRYSWMNFIRAGSNDLRIDRPKLFYPIIAKNKNEIRIPEMKWDELRQEYTLLEMIKEGEELVYPIKINNGTTTEKRWQRGHIRVAKELEEYRVRRSQSGETIIDFKTRMDEEAMPVTWWDKNEYASANYGATELKDLFGIKPFDFPKAEKLVEDSILACGMGLDKEIVMDFFGGSGTTGHAVINLNREDQGNRKFILIEMGVYFDKVTKPRIQKVIYSKDWKDGKPISREGISHCFKYMRLESYEDTLNNLVLQQSETQQQVLELSQGFKEGFMLNYMLDVETQDSLLNLKWFENPFNCYLDITRNNELQATKVDLIETFNYLIGLVVESYAVPKEGYKVVTGKNLAGESILVVWRNCTMHNSIALNTFLEKSKYNPLDSEYDRIYVNGDNYIENLKLGDERWKVVLIEEEFKKRMFENLY